MDILLGVGFEDTEDNKNLSLYERFKKSIVHDYYKCVDFIIKYKIYVIIAIFVYITVNYWIDHVNIYKNNIFIQSGGKPYEIAGDFDESNTNGNNENNESDNETGNKKKKKKKLNINNEEDDKGGKGNKGSLMSRFSSGLSSRTSKAMGTIGDSPLNGGIIGSSFTNSLWAVGLLFTIISAISIPFIAFMSCIYSLIKAISIKIGSL